MPNYAIIFAVGVAESMWVASALGALATLLAISISLVGGALDLQVRIFRHTFPCLAVTFATLFRKVTHSSTSLLGN